MVGLRERLWSSPREACNAVRERQTCLTCWGGCCLGLQELQKQQAAYRGLLQRNREHPLHLMQASQNAAKPTALPLPFVLIQVRRLHPCGVSNHAAIWAFLYHCSILHGHVLMLYAIMTDTKA